MTVTCHSISSGHCHYIYIHLHMLLIIHMLNNTLMIVYMVILRDVNFVDFTCCRVQDFNPQIKAVA